MTSRWKSSITTTNRGEMAHENSPEGFRLIDVFKTDELVIDKWTFVLNERDPWTSYYTMLGTDEDGHLFSQFTSGFYEPGEANPHLGERPRLIGEALLNHVLERTKWVND